ncbi:Actin, cytoplasmic [Seminavis robusta]|uniref:Actin, cytoplasmic n=1 Tax=Seminavis robusta TaxID=568900 RepID=A0A9N8DIP5_9STRA|nr:Actin, cytoplasmic [Seminavis robusta]|eukprot:Sro142_g066120.1 Actin, cytoplasmic (398) ;mRNA; r:24520-25713
MKDVIVCDVGSHSIKLGFAGDHVPSLVVPCFYGKSDRGAKETVYFGAEALEESGVNRIELKLVFDAAGTVKEWRRFEELFTWALRKLVGDDENAGVFSSLKLFLPRPANMNNDELQKLSELLFEKLKFRAVTMQPEAALILMVQGHQTTGLIVEAGAGSIRLLPVYHGHAIVAANRRIPIGGRVMTRHLVKLLGDQGYPLNAKRDFDLIVSDPTKQSFCYAAPSYAEEKRCSMETSLLLEQTQLLDGTEVDLEKERFETVECMFNPSLLGIEAKGIGHAIVELVATSIPLDCVKDIVSRIILSGGLSRIPGLLERLQAEVRTQFRDEKQWNPRFREEKNWTPLQVENISVELANEEFSLFHGASIVGDAIGMKREFWVTQNDYKRDGVPGLLKKCRL